MRVENDSFWSSFYKKPAVIPPVDPGPFSYDKETDLLKAMCRGLLALPVAEIEPKVRTIQQMSDEFALESPLTPSTSMFQAIEAGAVGETFADNTYVVCKCKRCERTRSSDWLKGPCGTYVVGHEPYSFVHVNLSRRVGSIEEFQKLVQPVFKEKSRRFRMLPGDSHLTLVMLASDREHEKEIRRILRDKSFRIERGIRIFDITKDLICRHKLSTPPPTL